jgi:hypothetical protein
MQLAAELENRIVETPTGQPTLYRLDSGPVFDALNWYANYDPKLVEKAVTDTTKSNRDMGKDYTISPEAVAEKIDEILERRSGKKPMPHFQNLIGDIKSGQHLPGLEHYVLPLETKGHQLSP